MNTDLVYSYLFSAGCFFLTGWAVMLVLACVVEFRQEWTTQPPPILPARPSR